MAGSGNSDMTDEKNTNANPQTTIVNVTQKVKQGGGCGTFIGLCIAAVIAVWGVSSCNDALENRTGQFQRFD